MGLPKVKWCIKCGQYPSLGNRGKYCYKCHVETNTYKVLKKMIRRKK